MMRKQVVWQEFKATLSSCNLQTVHRCIFLKKEDTCSNLLGETIFLHFPNSDVILWHSAHDHKLTVPEYKEHHLAYWGHLFELLWWGLNQNVLNFQLLNEPMTHDLSMVIIPEVFWKYSVRPDSDLVSTFCEPILLKTYSYENKIEWPNPDIFSNMLCGISSSIQWPCSGHTQLPFHFHLLDNGSWIIFIVASPLFLDLPLNHMYTYSTILYKSQIHYIR